MNIDADTIVTKKSATVFVVLTARAVSVASGRLGPWDVAVAGSGLTLPFDDPRWISADRPLGNSAEAYLARTLGEIALGVREAGGSVPLLITAYANDLHAFFVRPLAQLLDAVQHARRLSGAERVLIIGPKTSSRRFVRYWMRTSESPRGSSDLFAAVASGYIHDACSDVAVETIHVPQDFASRFEVMRRFFLGTANLVFTVKFVLRALMLRWKLGIAGTIGSPLVAIVRGPHQARFAADFARAHMNSDEKLDLLVMPQFAHGGNMPVLREIEGIPGLKAGAPSVSDIFGAIVSGLREARLIRREALDGAFHFETQSVRFAVPVSEIASELTRMPLLLSHRFLIERAISRLPSVKAILTYEMVARPAGFERFAADACGCLLIAIQTALVASRPHPVFPYADIFFSDSETGAVMLSTVGTARFGHVTYVGLPYAGVASKPVSGLPTRITYVTQPYETAVSRAILSTLGRFAERTGALIRVKLHPRDSAASYASISGAGSLFDIDLSTSPVEAIRWSEVVIGRTSSVLKEAVAHGRPVIACLWSEMDRSVDADYLSPCGAYDYRAFDQEGLERLLSAGLEPLAQAAGSLRRRIFGDGSLEELKSAVFEAVRVGIS